MRAVIAGTMCLPDHGRPNAQLMSPVKTLRVPGPLRHQPEQTLHETFIKRAPGEVLLLRRVERHHPLAAGVVDSPGATATAGGDRSAEGVLERTLFERGIDAGLSDGPGEIYRSF